jgi:hypothetical protein
MKVVHTTYGPGGLDPRKPNNNILSEEVVDVPDPPPSVSVKDLRAQLQAAGSVAATKVVLGTILNILDPNDPTQAAP